jgi:hypothetical protein
MAFCISRGTPERNVSSKEKHQKRFEENTNAGVLNRDFKQKGVVIVHASQVAFITTLFVAAASGTQAQCTTPFVERAKCERNHTYVGGGVLSGALLAMTLTWM